MPDSIVRTITSERTSQRRILPGNELREKVPEQRLKGFSLVEKQSPRRQEHVVRIPRLRPVEQ